MNKYKEALMANINRQLEAWFDQTEPIPHAQVHLFLHSIKGTAGTIGLADLALVAQGLLEVVEASSASDWQAGELRAFLFELIRNSYEHATEPELLLEAEGGEIGKPGESGESVKDQPLVLILDDDVTLLMYLKEELEKIGWSVIATTHPNKAIDYFHDVSPDCLVLDIHIPQSSGLDVMQTLQEKIKKQYVPTTIISYDSDKATRLKAYRMGADDVMSKPLDMEEFVTRLERQLNHKRWLDRVLFVDELTGAYNRKYLQEAYERLSSEALRTGANFSLVLLDLDHFKQVNDRYGHLIGDQVLTGFSSYIRSSGRTTDLLIRYGGEEFVLLMPRTGTQEAKLALERMIAQFSEMKFDSPQGEFSISFSAGVVEVTDPQLHRQYWLQAADQALYAAKKLGRKRVEAAGSSNMQPSKKKIKIAVVDDDAIVRAMLTEYMKDCFGDQAEAEVRTYRNGELFMDDVWHGGDDPCIVLLDGMMPGMDGLEVLRRIRTLPNAGQYKVIMLTGRRGEQDIARALQLGADDYITKPFGIQSLEARIRKLVRQVI